MYNHQLDTFVQAADAGSFSKVADAMHVSPTAVIKQINQLESRLGIQLFNRTHRGVTLTEAGISLYQDAKYVIQYSKDSLTRARNAMDHAGHTKSVIRIGTSLMTPSRFMIELWPKMYKLIKNSKKMTFQLVSFENTPENAVEKLKNLGQHIDVVAGVFDEEFLRQRKCAALELSREPICCALSLHHPLVEKAEKKRLSVQDLYGENLMLIKRGWNSYVDALRDGIERQHPQINIIEFPFYNVNVFNQCESKGNLLMAMDMWEGVHPLLKILPVDWDYKIPFGILHSPKPSKEVSSFLRAVAEVFESERKAASS